MQEDNKGKFIELTVLEFSKFEVLEAESNDSLNTVPQTGDTGEFGIWALFFCEIISIYNNTII